MATRSNGYAMDGVPWSCKQSSKAQRSKSGPGLEKNCNAAPSMAGKIFSLTAPKVRPQAGSYGVNNCTSSTAKNSSTTNWIKEAKKLAIATLGEGSRTICRLR